MPLLDAKGQPVKFTKAKPPKTGERYGPWAGRNYMPFLELRGGSFIQFDLSKLVLKDYRQMTMHYQINSSLMMQMFMAHQAKWKIRHPDRKVRHLLTETLENLWTPLTRSMAQAHWSGYSPNILEW